MAPPWDRYAAPETAPADGPWAKFDTSAREQVSAPVVEEAVDPETEIESGGPAPRPQISPMASMDDVGPRGNQARPYGAQPAAPIWPRVPTTADLQSGASAASAASLRSGDGPVVTPSAGDAGKIAEDQAGRAAKGKVIDEAIRRASISARGGQGFNDKISSEFQRIAFNPKQMAQFSLEERAAIEAVAKGGLLRNSLSILGNISSQGGPLSKLIASPATGIARWAGGALANRQANNVGDIVRSGPQGSEGARIQQQYANDIKVLNDKINTIIGQNGGRVPRGGEQMYRRYAELSGQRADIMREYMARAMKNPGKMMAGASRVNE